MLTFCIPTWNRADKLRLCLESIGEAIKGLPMDICVYNNGSTDNTGDVLAELSAKYPIKYITCDDHLDFSRSYARATSMSGSEWSWTFGDDDLLIDAKSIMPLLNLDVDFIHITEKSRSKGENNVYPGTLLELCKAVGLIEMTGFISGNVFRTAPMMEALNGSRMSAYSSSAFPQSLCALDAFHDKKSLLIDMPLIELQDAEQTPETMLRWRDDNTAMNYSNIVDGLELLRGDGIIEAVLPPAFFRYLSGSFLAKCMHAYWLETINTSTKLSDEKWSKLFKIAAYFSDEMIETVRVFRVKLNDYCDFCETGLALIKGMEESCEEATPFTYPITYI